MAAPRALIAFAVALLPATTAHAWDYAVRATLSETVEANSNIYLRSPPRGWAAGAYSYFKTEFQARTPTMQFWLDADVNYRRQFGPDVTGNALQEVINNQVHSRFEAAHKMPGEKTWADFNYARRNIASVLLDELGLPSTGKGDIHTTRLQVGTDRAPTRYDTFNFSARAALNEYTPSTAGTRYLDVGGQGNWNHRFNERFRGIANSEIQWLDYENAARTDILVLRERFGFDWAVTRLLTWRANGGVVVIHTGYGNLAALPAGTAASTRLAFIGDTTLVYKLFKTTDVSLSVARNTSAGVLGTLSEMDSISGTLTHRVNNAMTATLNASAVRTRYTDSTYDTLTASASYAWQLTRDWNAQFVYRFIHRDVVSAATGAVIVDPATGIPIPIGPTGSRADSHAVLATLTGNFTVLPFGR